MQKKKSTEEGRGKFSKMTTYEIFLRHLGYQGCGIKEKMEAHSQIALGGEREGTFHLDSGFRGGHVGSEAGRISLS